MQASEISDRLAQNAEAVCRRYLSNGRREGRYWRVGDLANTPGRSLFVGLEDPRRGRWCDAATGEHGDLLDLIAARLGVGLGEALREARTFLSVPAAPDAVDGTRRTSPDAARRLFTAAGPIASTPAEAYLHRRGLRDLRQTHWLRHHPRCFCRQGRERAFAPALVAAVTDLSGIVQGVQRLWLTRDGAKAPFSEPRRSMGRVRGHAVRIGGGGDVVLAGEGLETVLSVRQVLPSLPVQAALSAANLAALILPPGVARLYIAVDDDPAGRRAASALAARAAALGVEVLPIRPRRPDFNDDLTCLGPARLARRIRAQVRPEDWARFSRPPAR